MTQRTILCNILCSKGKVISFAVLFVAIFFVLRTLPHRVLLWQFYHLDTVSFARFMEVFWENTITSMSFSTLSSNVIAIILPLLIALNIVLFITYYRMQRSVLAGKSLFASLGGMVLGLFGVGCFACSGLLLAPLISFFGLAGVFGVLPYGGQELAYVGLFLLLLSNIYLIKKINQPNVCT